MSTVPTPPTIPTVLTPTTLATLVGAVCAYVLSILTYSGVVLPPSVNAKVQAIIGLVTLGVGVIGSAVAMLSHHSVQKVALKAATTTPLIAKPDPVEVDALVHAELARLAATLTPAAK